MTAKVGMMLIDLGFVLIFVAMWIALWDLKSEFLWPTLYVVAFCLVVGFLMDTFL